jgi:outer membrane receptor protein involved in Fe transport
VPAAPPADFSGLEAALRASPLGPLLADVPQGALFTNSAQVPVFALGNEDLDVEHITSWEVGWKSQVTSGVFVTADAYYARLNGFVTELLPGVNPTYGPWTAPEQVAIQNRATVEAAVTNALTSVGQAFAAAALTRLRDGSTAIVVSVGNSGRAKEYGLELGVTGVLSSEFEVDANYSYSGFEIDASSFGAATQILPNTPRHKGNVSLAYEGPTGFDMRLSGRFVTSYDWAGGVFIGRVPAQQTADLTAGYRITPALRASLTATNVLDQRRYQVFGGPLIGRRVLAGLTATF